MVTKCWPVQHQSNRWSPSFCQCSTRATGGHQALAGVTPEQQVFTKCLPIDTRAVGGHQVLASAAAEQQVVTKFLPVHTHKQVSQGTLPQGKFSAPFPYTHKQMSQGKLPQRFQSGNWLNGKILKQSFHQHHNPSSRQQQAAVCRTKSVEL